MSDSANSRLMLAKQRIAAHYRVAESELLPALIASLDNYDNQFAATRNIAQQLLDQLRGKQERDWLSAFLNEYQLSNAEGLALLKLSEALLRVPDTATTNQLLRDKLGQADWQSHRGQAESWLINTATLGLSVAQSLLDDERGILHTLVVRMGEPVVRNVAITATRLLANHFVLGETIDDALARARREELTCSFDMLGEAARTKVDAERYFNAYSHAIEKIGSDRSSVQHAISVKLSALHPRYEPLQHRDAVPMIAERLAHLATLAAQYNLQLTVDAEESERLELSLQIVERVARMSSLRDWHGLGLAVQAYQKRALPVLQWTSALARDIRKPIKVRLVKGAYWDSEIKRCQQTGLIDYPVFTRKSATDTSYLACAHFMMKDEYLHCAFATHNALTVAQLLNWMNQYASVKSRMEFQRLHGMGAEFYARVRNVYEVECRVYAPAGGHHELLAYLVRRMLENGANSSFVQQLRRDDLTKEILLADPVNTVRKAQRLTNQSIMLPENLYGDARRNSTGIDLSDASSLQQLDAVINKANHSSFIAGVIGNTKTIVTTAISIRNPATHSHVIGHVSSTKIEDIPAIVEAAQQAHEAWSLIPVNERAICLERTADLLQQAMPKLMALLIAEAGKTRLDAMNEAREAIDFCRYYATTAHALMSETKLPGPTGEANTLSLASRGVFACISPWNFPLAIFIGQITAALVTGNSVVAKPAPQTPLIAAMTTRLMHQAGIPDNVLHLVLGDAAVGEALIDHPLIAGVAFTGSTATARRIAQTLLNNPSRPLVPLIAETGGINAMIVDSTALPEQVVNDVIISAFHSAGQRCSALRLLCLQDEIYETVLTMLQGAMDELRVGNPADEDTDIGPVIDAAAQQKINQYLDSQRHKIRHQIHLDQSPGYFVAPTVIEIDSPKELQQEIFGPILHITRWKSGALRQLIDDINASGFGLTMGVHTRLDSTITLIRKHARVGNLYVNRSMIGAVVGVQPFGGEGLSGTGFKAGGPHYLLRFCTERTVSIDTTAAGGNTALLSNSQV